MKKIMQTNPAAGVVIVLVMAICMSSGIFGLISAAQLFSVNAGDTAAVSPADGTDGA